MKFSYQNAVLENLKKASKGQAKIFLPDETCVVCGCDNRSPLVEIRILDHAFFKAIVHRGGIGLGEAYQRGHWTSPDVTNALEWLLVNSSSITPNLNPLLSKLVKKANALLDAFDHYKNRNTVDGSRENIHAHYDLGNEFYKTFLDPTMTYSSAYFKHVDDSLEDGQYEKYDRLCRKLQLNSMRHVLEIGCGWGGFAIHAAKHFGCHVTATTISKEQFAEAKRRVVAAGLQSRIHVTMTDYRKLQGSFDRIASIEMLEAVGQEFLGQYFQQVEALLAPNGLAAVQVITCPNPLYKDYSQRVDWIQKHIFPGSHLPSSHALLQAAEEHGELDAYHLESFGLHYARTLSEWRERFVERWPEIKLQGFDEAFKRKWEYYLSYCEAGFKQRHVNVFQIVFGRADEVAYEYETDASFANEEQPDLTSLNVS